MITFTCSSCSRKYTVRDDFAGKRTKCTGCGIFLTVPSPTAAEPEVVIEVVEEGPTAPPTGIQEPSVRAATGRPGKPAPRPPADDDGDTDDMPRRKAAGKRPADHSRMLLIGGGISVVAVAGIVLAVFLMMKPSPAPKPTGALAVAQGRPSDSGGITVITKPQTAPKPDEPVIEKPVETDQPKTAVLDPKPGVGEPNTAPDEPKLPVGAKVPVPDATKLDRANAAIRSKYKTGRPLAAGEAAQLAEQMIEDAQKSKVAAQQYALLLEARNQAIRAADLAVAFKAVDAARLRFELDEVEWTTTPLEKIAQSPDTPDSVLSAVAERALELATEHTAKDRYAAAAKLLGIANDAAKKSESPLRPMVEDRRLALDLIQKEYVGVEVAKQKLATNPEDPAANLAWAKFLATVLGKWDRALPHFVRSGDAGLKTAAEKDIANPREEAGQIELADAWRTLGQAENGPMRKALLTRARHWYAQAAPMLNGDPLTKVEKQIKDIDALMGATTSTDLQPTGSSVGGRTGKTKELLIAREGGNAQSEAAVEAGLKWIARHQALDGHWGMHDFHVAGKCNCSGSGGQNHDIAGTAFGLLPLLASGQTHKGTGKTQPYAKHIGRGLTWLLTRQAADGAFSPQGYEHALATIAVCEAYGMTADPALKRPAQKAIDCCVAWQHQAGGFRYQPRTPGDLSVSVWFVQALKSGSIAGLNVPNNTWTGINAYLGTVSTPDGSGFGYQQPTPAPTMTAAGLLARQYLGGDPKSLGVFKGVANLQKLPPSPNFKNMMFYYYTTQVMFHHGSVKPDDWKGWNLKMRDMLIEQQDKGMDAVRKDQVGSWSPEGDAWGGQMGRLGHTSMAILTLEVYYRYLPLYRRDLGPMAGEPMPEGKK